MWDAHVLGRCLLIRPGRKEFYHTILLFSTQCIIYISWPPCTLWSTIQSTEMTLVSNGGCNENTSGGSVKELKNHESSATPWQKGKSICKSRSCQLNIRRVGFGRYHAGHPILSSHLVNEQIKSLMFKLICTMPHRKFLF